MSVHNRMISVVLLILICSGVVHMPLGAQDAEKQVEKDAAKSAYDAIRDRIGNSEAIEKNLTSPITGGASFSTFDGRQQFSQPVSCPSSQAYLELFYGIGSGGDLMPLTVKQDSDFNGQFDWAPSLTGPVSGVCANGVISCRAGTFDDCRALGWQSSGGKLRLEETELRELAGCYCVNNSCGSGLAFSNRATILDDLAGGMAGALMVEDARYAVSAVSREDFLIRLSGQDAGACNVASGTTGSVRQEQYVDDPMRLSSDAFTASSSDRTFGLVSNIPSGDAAHLSRSGCKIERQVTLDEVLASDIIARVTSSADYAESSCAGDPDCFLFSLGDNTDNHIEKKGCNIFTEEVVWTVDRLDRLNEARLIDSDYEDQIHVSVNGTMIFATGGFNGASDPDDCQIDDQRSVSINRSFRHALKEGVNRMTLKIAVRKRGSGQVRGIIRYEPGCDLVETLDSTCGPFASNDDCRLIAETVDGVSTWRNGGRTGLTPLRQTRTLYGAKCTETFSRDWFSRDRDYECESDNAAGRGFDFTRMNHIFENSGTSSYSDLREGSDGSPQVFGGTYSFDTDYGTRDCEQICRVSVTEPDTEVASAGVVGALHKNPNTENYRYLNCAGNVCPAGPGETIEKDCGCLSEFNDAITVMQTFRLAGQDLTCTTGVQQKLD